MPHPRQQKLNSQLKLARRQLRGRNTLVCVKIQWRVRFPCAAASEVEFWISFWSQVGLRKKINLLLRGSNLVGCQTMARVVTERALYRLRDWQLLWKDNLLFQQRVVEGVGKAIITNKGHQGSRDQEALATPNYHVQKTNSRRKAKKKRKREKHLSVFFIILLIFITLNSFSFQCTIYFWLWPHLLLFSFFKFYSIFPFLILKA